MKFFAVGLSYKTAPVEVRERLAIAPSKLACFACQLKIGAGLSEVVLVSTCNRVEIYGVTDNIDGPFDRFFPLDSIPPTSVAPPASLFSRGTGRNPASLFRCFGA